MKKYRDVKKIALLIESLGSGGAQRQLVGLGRMLRSSGFDVKVFCYYDIDFYAKDLEDGGVPYEVVHDDKRHLTRIPRIAHALRRFAPDVVISYLDTPSLMACIIKGFTFAKWKLIVSERNTTQVLTRRGRLKFWLYRYANAIVPNSYSQGRFIEDHYPSLVSKIRVITNFVDTDYFSPSEADIESKDGKLRMVCVGRIVPQKNIERFLEALVGIREKLVGRLKVDWYGEKYDSSYYNRCNEIIENGSLKEIFEFHAPFSEIRDVYRRSDIFCLPSTYEGFPNVLCEAMSCGLPVICSGVCDNPKIADDEKSGYLFDPGSIESITAVITRILDLDVDDRKKMGDFNRGIALKMFSEDAFLKKYIEVINPIIVD